MECNKWEAVGLLYSTGELANLAGKEFSEHLQVCVYCRQELAFYQSVRQMSGESNKECIVPASIDLAMQRAITAPMQVSGRIFGFAPAARKVLFATLLFALGLGGGTYVVLNVGSAAHNRVAVTSVVTPVAAVSDSATDSVINNSVSPAGLPPKNTIGSSVDIIPVGLESSK